MRTKIYGTIGPACCGVETLAGLFEKGMTGVRINLSHSGLAEAAAWIANIHSAYECFLQTGKKREKAEGRNESCGERPEILMDLRGPELRIGALDAPLKLVEGTCCFLAEGTGGQAAGGRIEVPAAVLPNLEPGQEVLLDDGRILVEPEERPAEGTKERGIRCRVRRGGVLTGGKSIALPGRLFRLPTLTKSDLENIRMAKTYGITGVMLPFVRDESDLVCLREALMKAGAGELRVFAKIENPDGVARLDSLLPHCDEIVIARGDLGNAVGLWQLPVIQAQIAKTCREAAKSFMVVTQMLATMELSAVPTRAEVSDIFRAVQEGAASVMLTGETAVGKYPVEAMEYLAKTVREAETFPG